MLYFEKHISNNNYDWVVFIHGLGGSSTIWYKQIEQFKRNFNLLLIDLHSHGNTTENLSEIMNISFEKIGQDIIKVLDYLKIKSCHFVGISLGTILIRSISINYPQRVKSMILGGAVLKFEPYALFLIKISYIIKTFMSYMLLYKCFAYTIMPRKHHKKSRSIFIREAAKLGRKEFICWLGLIKKLNLFYLQTQKQIKIPKLYIMGSQDYMFIKSVKKETLKDKYSKLIILSNCGHVCNIESANKFNNNCIYFLNEINYTK